MPSPLICYKNFVSIADYSYTMRSKPINQVKRHGVFYTPKTIATLMARMLSIPKNKVVEVLDPTCGSGRLLDAVKEEHPNAKTYGVEIDKKEAKMAALLHEITNESWLDHELGSGYEYCIANPPYFNVRNCTQEERTTMKKEYRAYDGNGDILNVCIEKAIRSLKDNGVLICIVQRYFLETEHAGLRNVLRENAITDIIDFKTEKLFKEVNCNAETCIVRLEKRSPKKNHKVKIHDGQEYAKDLLGGNMPKEKMYKVEQKSLTGKRWMLGEINEAAKITSSLLLEDICEVGVGYLTSADKAFEVPAEEVDIEPIMCKQVIKNKDIKPNQIAKPSGKWICPKDKDVSKYPKAYSLLQERKEALVARPLSFKNRSWYDYKGYQNPHITEASEKIVFRSFAPGPSFAMSKSKNHIYSNNVGGLILKKEYQKSIELKSLMEYLNSETAFAYMKSHLLKKKASGFDFKPNALRKLPVPESIIDKK